MKIPLYNKGVGATGITTGGSLGPRATSGAFTGVGQQLAAFGKEADRIATDFFDAEAQSVADDAITKASLEYKEKISEFNRTNGSLSVAEYDDKFRQFKNIELNIAKNKFKLRKDFQQKFDNSLEIIAANGKEQGRQSSFAKGTKVRAQNAQNHISTIIDELVVTKEPGAVLKLKQKLKEQEKINLANGYTPFLKYKTAEEAVKEADRRGLLVDISDEGKTLEELQLMQKEVINPESKIYKDYSASERDTFSSKIQGRINEITDGRSSELDISYKATEAQIILGAENSDELINELEKKYHALGEPGKKLFLPLKLNLLIEKGAAERVKPYEFQSVESMQTAIMNQEARARSAKGDKAYEEVQILIKMKEKFSSIASARTGDPVLYIKTKLKQEFGEVTTGLDVTTEKLVSMQKRMGFADKDIKIYSTEEIKSIYNEYDSMEPAEASNFLKNLVEEAREKGHEKYLIPQMMKNGFTQYENLTMINPTLSINNTFLSAKKSPKEFIDKRVESADQKSITQEVNREFNNFRESAVGQSQYGSILSGNGRSDSVDAVEMAIAKTAIYIKATNPSVTNSEAVNQAMSIINSSYDIRTVNYGAYRIPNDKVMKTDQDKVHRALTSVISDKKSLEKIVKLPPGARSFNTYIGQAGTGLRWITNESETGVFLVNANANGSQVISKETGNRIEYTWDQLINKGTLAEQTAKEKRDIQIFGVTKEEVQGLDSEQLKELRLNKAKERYQESQQKLINLGKK